MTSYKPMLAAKTPGPDYRFKYPVLVSPKLDGVRAIVKDGVLLSRSLKRIPNLHCQKLFARPEFEGLGRPAFGILGRSRLAGWSDGDLQALRGVRGERRPALPCFCRFS